MKRISLSILSLLALLGTTGCEEVVTMDLAEDKPRLVVEGMIRDASERTTVTLTWTTPWYKQGPPPAATGATLRLTDGETEWALLDDENTGIYRTPTPVSLPAGKEYLLTIDIEGHRYEARSLMKPVAPILNLSHRYVSEEDASLTREQGYYLTLYAQDPPEEGDYYYWKLFLDDSLFDGIGDVLYTDDRFVNGNSIVWEIPITIPRAGQVRLEQMAITKGNYDFLAAFSILVQANGNPFAPQPANPPTNIRCVSDPENYAFGYFGAAAVAQAEVAITP
ncbi:MAG: DUF4249 domain-containing protein [Bacteroidetes bacterium]|nr:DUF4249 domain-containing protein [Bacteroidota bacterium]